MSVGRCFNLAMRPIYAIRHAMKRFVSIAIVAMTWVVVALVLAFKPAWTADHPPMQYYLMR